MALNQSTKSTEIVNGLNDIYHFLTTKFCIDKEREHANDPTHMIGLIRELIEDLSDRYSDLLKDSVSISPECDCKEQIAFFEKTLQKNEASIRSYIKNNHQIRLHCESLQSKYDEILNKNNHFEKLNSKISEELLNLKEENERLLENVQSVSELKAKNKELTDELLALKSQHENEIKKIKLNERCHSANKGVISTLATNKSILHSRKLVKTKSVGEYNINKDRIKSLILQKIAKNQSQNTHNSRNATNLSAIVKEKDMFTIDKKLMNDLSSDCIFKDKSKAAKSMNKKAKASTLGSKQLKSTTQSLKNKQSLAYQTISKDARSTSKKPMKSGKDSKSTESTQSSTHFHDKALLFTFKSKFCVNPAKAQQK